MLVFLSMAAIKQSFNIETYDALLKQLSKLVKRLTSSRAIMPMREIFGLLEIIFWNYYNFGEITCGLVLRFSTGYKERLRLRERFKFTP